MRSDVDVLVLGGGPAGAATALALARGGWSVAVVTRARPDRPRIGETVPPTIMRSLAQLGVWADFLADDHLAAPGTLVCWGDDKPYENDFIFHPYGHGWHLDRARFDAMLIGAARAAGAQVREIFRGGRVEHGGCGWSVADRSAAVVRAPFLVDATGRAARAAAQLGVPRNREDRLIGLVRFGAAACSDPRTLLESCAQGWWYAAVLPNARAVIALFTDADLLPASVAERELMWTRELSATRLVRDVMAPSGASRVHATAAHTGALGDCVGPDWLAVGDAARTVDPLSGQGLTAACTSALRASDAIPDAYGKDVLESFSAQNAAEHRADLALGLAHYRREERWVDRPFWQRRHQRLSAAA